MDVKQAELERANAKRYVDLTRDEREHLHRVASVRLWGDATPDTLFTKNRKGEWCTITAR